MLIKSISTSLGFAVTDKMVRELNLKVDDEVDIVVKKIVRGGVANETELFFSACNVIKSGGVNGGIILDKKLLKANNIGKGVTLNIEIEKVE